MHCIDTPRFLLKKDSLHYNNSIKKTMEKVVAKDLVREAKLVKKNISVVSSNQWTTNTQQVRGTADQKRRMILGKSLNNQVKKQISHCLSRRSLEKSLIDTGMYNRNHIPSRVYRMENWGRSNAHSMLTQMSSINMAKQNTGMQRNQHRAHLLHTLLKMKSQKQEAKN